MRFRSAILSENQNAQRCRAAALANGKIFNAKKLGQLGAPEAVLQTLPVRRATYAVTLCPPCCGSVSTL
jgi:hypothetical protein